MGKCFNGTTGSKSATEEKGLKIFTANQMLSRLPIPLGQLNAGNNSEKLRQFFVQIKKLTKQLYNNFINTI